jgi:hypothetical protein
MSLLQQDSAQPHHHLVSTHRPQKRIIVASAPVPPPITSTGAAGDGSAPQATVDCYTCRRRRVKCDRALPHCAKCERTKLECLGYKKPLVWNKGVASRGKMMGKTFPAPQDSTEPVAKRVPAPAPAVHTAPIARTAHPVRVRASSRDSSNVGLVQRRDGEARQRREAALVPTGSSVFPRTALGEISFTLPMAPSSNPFFSLDEASRLYMQYCKYIPLLLFSTASGTGADISVCAFSRTACVLRLCDV